jgi:hypothetical protein
MLSFRASFRTYARVNMTIQMTMMDTMSHNSKPAPHEGSNHVPCHYYEPTALLKLAIQTAIYTILCL